MNKNNKKFLIYFVVGALMLQLMGCNYYVKINGVDTKNSTKVSKVQFVKEYDDTNYKNEEIVNLYEDTKGLYGQVYFENVPDTETKITFQWKDKKSGTTIATADIVFTSSEAKVPVKSYIEGEEILPGGTYILETYLKDTNALLNTSEIEVINNN